MNTHLNANANANEDVIVYVKSVNNPNSEKTTKQMPVFRLNVWNSCAGTLCKHAA